MFGPASFSRDAGVAASARELLDRAAATVEAMAAAQRDAIGDLLELWPCSAWRAAGCVSAKAWLMAYAGQSGSEAHRLERITELCFRDGRLAEAVVSGELGLGRAESLARAVTDERARFLTGEVVANLLALNSRSVDDDDWATALRWWRELVDQELAPRRELRQTVITSPSLFGGGEIHGRLLPAAFANVVAGLDAFTQDPDPADAPYRRSYSERRADALDDMASFALTHDTDDDNDGFPVDDEDEELRGEDVFDGFDPDWDSLDEAQSLTNVQLDDLERLELLRRRLRRRMRDQHRRSQRRIRARSGTRANIHIDLRSLAALRGFDDFEDLILRGQGWTAVRSAVEQMLCDATLVATLFDGSGKVLDSNDEAERWSKRQRRAIAARDRCCVFPGCTRAPKYCDIHHLEERHRGGPTTVANGALLCRFHHTLLHQHRWRLFLDDGTWTAIDPHRVVWTGRRTSHPTAA